MNHNKINISNLFMEKFIDGANLHSLVNLTSEIFNNPVMLCDIKRNPIKLSDNYPENSIEDHLNMRKQITPNEHESFERSITELVLSGKPYMFSYKFVRNKYLSCGCIFNNNAIGILVLPDIKNLIDESVYPLIEYIAKIFAIALIINGCPTYKKDNFNHEFLWGLLTQSYPTKFLEKKIQWNIFNGIKTFQLLWYLPIDNEENNISRDVLSKLNSTMKNWWSIPFEKGYITMTDGNETKGIQALDNISRKIGLLVSTSDIYTDIKDTISQFQLSKDVYVYAKKNGQNSGVAKYDDYKIFRLLSFAKEKVDINKLKVDVLTIIDEYDIINKSEYGLTLRTYLINNLSFQDTAKKLFIHKNTVSYRIKRIHELFNLDFNDIKKITTLYYSILLEQ